MNGESAFHSSFLRADLVRQSIKASSMAPFALTLTIGAASAQQQAPEFSLTQTETCLAEPETAAGKGHCVGLSAVACMATENGSTTVGNGYCLEQERLFWDARLNAVYQRLMEVERGLDAEMAELGSAAPPMAPGLREMQRAWIAFRDAACDYEARQWGGGTGAGPAYIGCLMTQTGRQALELETRLNWKQAQ